MPIRIIEDDDIQTCEIGDSKFHYKRMGVALQTDLTTQCRDTRGRVNEHQFALKTLEACLTGWENVAGKDGDLEFKKELIGGLPPDVAAFLFMKIVEASPAGIEQLEDDLKNSMSISS